MLVSCSQRYRESETDVEDFVFVFSFDFMHTAVPHNGLVWHPEDIKGVLDPLGASRLLDLDVLKPDQSRHVVIGNFWCAVIDWFLRRPVPVGQSPLLGCVNKICLLALWKFGNDFAEHDLVESLLYLPKSAGLSMALL